MKIRGFVIFTLALAQFISLFADITHAHGKGVDPEEKVEYYLYDHLGGVDVMMDEQGNVVERRDYLPYGEERIAEGSAYERHGFTGKELDGESGLYYYGARYYDPAIGRFTAIDPLVLGEAGKPIRSILGDPQEMNGYTYARNNPLRFIDPTGMFKQKTGEVEKGDTLGAITKTVNSANGTNYSVSQFAQLNRIDNPDKIFPGQKLIPNGIIKDVTSALKVEMAKWGGAISQFKNEDASGKVLIFGKYSVDPNKMNLKVRPNSVFNTSENNAQNYVFQAEEIRSDAPANILYGYVSKQFGLMEFASLFGAGFYQSPMKAISTLVTNGIFQQNDYTYGDDATDNLYIRKGMAIYDNK